MSSELPASPESRDDRVSAAASSGWSDLVRLEDWWAVWLGGGLLAIAFAFVWSARPDDWPQRLEEIQAARQASAASGASAEETEALRKRSQELRQSTEKQLAAPFKSWVAKPRAWRVSPTDAVYEKGKANALPAMATLLLVCLLVFTPAVRVMGAPAGGFAAGFVVLFVL